ncbi:uncharacterized protein LOC112500445 [Cynara cardunculus var. scolymus]|uniref:Uncharacterized protein n=1 Tax=Cynara cardunculus var. scolymus TaxID=59895 RepID=A0A103Y448_CYNCS|nr:uncharacterized protein LOC112500445 [Cynara cardunculus var. scolymus]KVI02181.1 hypothetical protein Ccrd_019523 [Cynara cardunculus var. scolymus]
MDSDRPPPHRTTSTSSTTTTTSDLFICFTSRHHHSSSSSTSSMKISSKSILSPGRHTSRDPPISLSTSLSRRLRTSRSIKGGASPAMFPTSGKKKGGGFENPEPSSPKVTCIGQVRVKSKKKQGKRLRTLSRRHSTGDVSFRKLDHNHHSRDGFSKSQNLGSNFQQGCNSFGSNQENLPEKLHNPRWVHLPLTICEALRALGSEFSCLFPCRSSCFSPATEREKEEKTDQRQGSGSGSCAAVFTRWLVAFQDGDDGGGRGGRREIELVVGGDDDDEGDDEIRSIRTSRRHVFDDLEIVNDRIEGCYKDEARLSICIPPKNALLLMRCRSDPLKMEALANRLWEPTIDDYEEEEDEDEYHIPLKTEAFDQEHEANQETILKRSLQEEDQETHNEYQETHEEDQEITFFGSLFDELVDQDQESDEMEDAKEELFEEEIQETEMESKIEKVKGFEEEVTQFGDRSETVDESKEREAGVLEREGLPECLLLMMCEPKLSMEVSKETWVSSKDFVRRHSSRKKPPAPPQLQPPIKPTNGQNESKVSSTTTTKGLASTTKYQNHVTAEDAAAAAVQPGRSSCSLPAPPSMAEMLEQKLVNAVGYEPFVLTRCKSEPMRTAAAKLAPDSCFWKNRKLEPLRRASFGVGAAGVGF